MRDLEKMQSVLADAPEGAVILTTEKDAVKLTNRRRIPEDIQRRLYFTPVHISFIEDSQNDFLKKLYFYVSANQKYGLLHSG
jgi:tetraacyldisaccharide 4'-kinase